MQNFLLPALLTIGAGVSVLIQQALNANLRSELNSAAWSGFMSYFLGIVCMVLLAVVLRDPVPSTTTISRVPLWAWSGGILGAIFIGLSIITIPKLGGALGDGPDDRCARRRSLWMDGRSGAIDRLATNAWRRTASRRRYTHPTLIARSPEWATSVFRPKRHL